MFLIFWNWIFNLLQKQEEEKEVERKKREEKERERRSDRSPASSISRNRSPIHDRSPASPAETVRHRSHKSSRHRTKSRWLLFYYFIFYILLF